MEDVVMWVIERFGGIDNIVYVGLGLFISKFLVEWLKVGTRKRYFHWLAGLADEITDNLIASYPDSEWIDRVDGYIDFFIEKLGFPDYSTKRVPPVPSAKLQKKIEEKKQIATRIISGALSRKALKGVITSEELSKAAKKLNGGTT
ncbi:MAG TPA: hypothetical protein ENO22_05590 [candidate division Zixibacteria bacterium]|nr:hypothetical protein [candidate division Zixibacteria bacterium]